MTDFQPTSRIPVLADPDPQLDTYRYSTIQVATLPAAVKGSQHYLTDPYPDVVPTEVVQLLGLQPDELAVCRVRLMRIRATSEPIEVNWSYYPAEFAAGTRLEQQTPIRGGVMPVLEALGLPPVDYEDRVTARRPTPWESGALLIPPHTSALQTLRIVWSHDAKPIEATVMIKGAHRVELLYRRAVR